MSDPVFMFAHGGSAPEGSTSSGRSAMGPGAPPFQLWRKSELPAEWQREPSQRDLVRAGLALEIPWQEISVFTSLEIPDIGPGRLYYQWAVEQLAKPENEADGLPVMLVVQSDFRGVPLDEARPAMEQFCFALLSSGKPPPFFTNFYGQRN